MFRHREMLHLDFFGYSRPDTPGSRVVPKPPFMAKKKPSPLLPLPLIMARLMHKEPVYTGGQDQGTAKIGRGLPEQRPLREKKGHPALGQGVRCS